MELLTEISDCGDGDVLIAYNGDCGLSPDKQAEHDLLAAHAYKQAMDEQLARHWTVVSDPAKKALLDARERAAEILAGWLGEECGCRSCNQPTWTNRHFVVCPKCGNKRCPKAENHEYACTGSNEPGQVPKNEQEVE